jgi:hypothetical protein
MVVLRRVLFVLGLASFLIGVVGLSYHIKRNYSPSPVTQLSPPPSPTPLQLPTPLQPQVPSIVLSPHVTIYGDETPWLYIVTPPKVGEWYDTGVPVIATSDVGFVSENARYLVRLNSTVYEGEARVYRDDDRQRLSLYLRCFRDVKGISHSVLDSARMVPVPQDFIDTIKVMVLNAGEVRFDFTISECRFHPSKKSRIHKEMIEQWKRDMEQRFHVRWWK